MLNRFEGIGNLGKDPETRVTTGANQTTVTRFPIAVNKGYGENKKTVWINIVALGKLAENCSKFLAKGRKVYVAGELDIREYDKPDGSKGYITEVVARDVEFLNSNESNGWTQPTAPPQPQAPAQPQPQPAWSNPQWTAPQQPQPPAQQNMTYQQYQEQKAQEQMQIPEGFAALQEEVPF